ncbi:hypothetical protein [Orrella dioscoreae]|uniref:hypothetical protein n=1 Tax=Orrella dioscoreae TaxID=1851544 RepID=UPI00082B5919|nr:hypothetical protein [Orrella dioscoreae]
MEVKAILPFEHMGTRRRGDVFEVSERVGERLVQKGLAKLVSPTVDPAPVDPAADAPVDGKPKASPRRTRVQQG